MTSIDDLQRAAQGTGPEAKEARKRLLTLSSRQKKTTRKGKRRDPEGDEQREVVRYLRDRGDLLFCSVPNEHQMPSERGRLVALGLSPGAPDLLIFTPFVIADAYSGLAIEMKRPDLERPEDPLSGTSPAQRQWIDDLGACRWRVGVRYTSTAAIRLIEECYGRPPRRLPARNPPRR